MATTTGGIELEAPPPRSSLPDISDEPLIIIQPTKSSEGLHLRDLWVYRELLYFLVWRDLKVRYKQTALGVLWIVLQPLFMTVIFTIFLGMLVRVPSDNIPYPLFAYAGLMIWSFFSMAVSTTGNSLIGNSHLITKVYFPRFIIPVASILARLLDLAVSFTILLGLMVYFRTSITPRILMAPFLVLLLALLALGLGMWTSAVNVKFRDVGIALPVVIQLWMFVSPVVYPLSLVPQKYQLIYSLNPLVGILEGFRSVIFGSPLNWVALALSMTITAPLLVYAAYAFRNRERTFADIV